MSSIQVAAMPLAPISGTIMEINEALVDAPEKINESCYQEGWILLVKPEDPSDLEGLMGAAAYREHVDGRDH